MICGLFSVGYRPLEFRAEPVVAAGTASGFSARQFLS